jgi:hypothetical protein
VKNSAEGFETIFYNKKHQHKYQRKIYSDYETKILTIKMWTCNGSKIGGEKKSVVFSFGLIFDIQPN